MLVMESRTCVERGLAQGASRVAPPLVVVAAAATSIARLQQHPAERSFISLARHAHARQHGVVPSRVASKAAHGEARGGLLGSGRIGGGARARALGGVRAVSVVAGAAAVGVGVVRVVLLVLLLLLVLMVVLLLLRLGFGASVRAVVVVVTGRRCGRRRRHWVCRESRADPLDPLGLAGLNDQRASSRDGLRIGGARAGGRKASRDGSTGLASTGARSAARVLREGIAEVESNITWPWSQSTLCVSRWIGRRAERVAVRFWSGDVRRWRRGVERDAGGASALPPSLSSRPLLPIPPSDYALLQSHLLYTCLCPLRCVPRPISLSRSPSGRESDGDLCLTTIARTPPAIPPNPRTNNHQTCTYSAATGHALASASSDRDHPTAPAARAAARRARRRRPRHHRRRSRPRCRHPPPNKASPSACLTRSTHAAPSSRDGRPAAREGARLTTLYYPQTIRGPVCEARPLLRAQPPPLCRPLPAAAPRPNSCAWPSPTSPSCAWAKPRHLSSNSTWSCVEELWGCSLRLRWRREGGASPSWSGARSAAESKNGISAAPS